MSDKSILFSEPMVRAILDGRKTQMRRVLNPRGFRFFEHPKSFWYYKQFRRKEGYIDIVGVGKLCTETIANYLPYSVGDRLWVRETYWQRGHWAETGEVTKGGRAKWAFVPADDEVRFERPDGAVRAARSRKDPSAIVWHKRLGRFMPRKYSRTTLVVTEVRVQRLQEISEEDAIAEGAYVAPRSKRVSDNHVFMVIGGWWFTTARRWYADLWDRLHGPDAWASNPFVSAYTFTVHRCNINAMETKP